MRVFPLKLAVAVMILLAGAVPVRLSAAPFVPNDPCFYAANTPGLMGQWYLDKTGTGALVDINVRGAWNRGLTGQGVKIGFVDGSFEIYHPDLNPNWDAADSWDFWDNDPIPEAISNAHGTAVAGLASACGGNGIGVTGVAPCSSWAGLGTQTAFDTYGDTANVQKLAAAFRYHSTGASPSLQIKSYSSYELSGFAQIAFPALADVDQAVIDSARAGTVTVAIAGNNRQLHGGDAGYDGDANKNHVAHLPSVISVTAADYTGHYAQYANWGACLTASIPSGETIWNGGVNLLTTDLLGSPGYNNPANHDSFANLDYTSVFTGTSAAAPIMSGVLALGIEAHNEAFGSTPIGEDVARYYKHLLALTCRVTDPDDSSPMGGWTCNTGGYHFNNNYGFGIVDADAFTLAATQYVSVSPLIVAGSGEIDCSKAQIPIGSSTGLTRSCYIGSTGPLEEVLIRLKINHDIYFNGCSYGELQGALISPTGTRSLFAFPNSGAPAVKSDPATRCPIDWTFTTNAFWGESGSGNWTLILSHPGTAGPSDRDYFCNSFEITTRSGSLVPLPAGIHGAKYLADDQPISASGCIVSAVFSGCFYVQDTNRTCGIKIESTKHVDAGDTVSISGTMGTTSGERCIRSTDPQVTVSGGDAPRPLGMPNKFLGGSARQLQSAVYDGASPAAGLSNIGLLVRTTGKVMDKGTGWILIDDGSGCYSGGSILGVKVLTTADPAVDSYVIVTGVSSCYIPDGATSPVRQVRACSVVSP